MTQRRKNLRVSVCNGVYEKGDNRNGYQGRFCGVSHWLQRKHGRWHPSRHKLELVGLDLTETGLHGDNSLVKDWERGVNLGEQGAVLRSPLAELRQSATILDLETYSWRPPWIRYKLGNFGGMDSNGEICGDRA